MKNKKTIPNKFSNLNKPAHSVNKVPVDHFPPELDHVSYTMRMLLIILLVLSMYNVKAQIPPCPCNPWFTATGEVSDNDYARWECYICLDHKPSNAKDESLRKNERLNKLYAFIGYTCPNDRHETWDDIKDYQWRDVTDPGVNGYGYQPNPIVFQISQKGKWKSEIKKQKGVHVTGLKKNPCKSLKFGKLVKTFATYWYQMNGHETTEIIKGKVKKSDTAHAIDDIHYDHESDSNHSTSYNYIDEYLIGIELIIIGQRVMILICCIFGIISGYTLKRAYDSSIDDGKVEFDRNTMD